MTEKNNDLQPLTDDDWDDLDSARKEVKDRPLKALALLDQLESMGIKNVEAIPELIAGCKALMEWQRAVAKEQMPESIDFRLWLTPSLKQVYDALSKLDGGMPGTTNG